MSTEYHIFSEDELRTMLAGDKVESHDLFGQKRVYMLESTFQKLKVDNAAGTYRIDTLGGARKEDTDG